MIVRSVFAAHEARVGKMRGGQSLNWLSDLPSLPLEETGPSGIDFWVVTAAQWTA